MTTPIYQHLPTGTVGGPGSGLDGEALRHLLARLEVAASYSFAIDPVSSFGLQLYVRGGAEAVDGAWVTINPAVLTLTDNAINYVEKAPGEPASLGSGAFTAGNSPLYQVQTRGGRVIEVVECRQALAEPATEAEVRTLTLTLTAAQVHDLFNTPATLVAALGAGKIAVLRRTFSIMSGQTRPFGEHNLHAYYDGFTPNTGADPAGGVQVIVASGLDEITAESVVWGKAVTFFGDVADALALPGTGSNEASSYANKAILLWAKEEMGTKGLAITYTITAGGADYQVADTIDLSDGSVITVATVDGGGAVLTFTITTPGTSIVAVGDSHSEDATSGGGDGNFTVDVATIGLGDGTVTIRVEYEIVTVA